jgi:hypothetical protein
MLLAPVLCAASILPDAIGPYNRISASPAALSDKPLWDEYGLKEAETAVYENGAGKLTATVWRFQDATGAMAAFDWQRPADSSPSKAAVQAAETPKGLLFVHGNYLLSLSGYKPAGADLDALKGSLAHVDTSPLPVLTGYLPSGQLVPNSNRYILGPLALQKFESRVPPSVAAFRFGTEAASGVFRSPKGDTTLAVFNYPTPQIAMQQLPEFQKIPGAAVKRSGPLIAVVVSPPDPDFAEHLLAGVRYQAEVTRDEYVPTRRDNIGDLILNIFVLIGILMGFSAVAGLAVGGVRTWIRRGKSGIETEAMITLHLEER